MITGILTLLINVAHLSNHNKCQDISLNTHICDIPVPMQSLLHLQVLLQKYIAELMVYILM